MSDITNRIDAVTKIDDIRIQMGGIQPPPKSVKIELTARCNLACKFCATSTRQKEHPNDMDFEFFQRITSDMRISGVEEIGLFYLGEPFMNVELLCKACDWVKHKLKFPYVFVTSNATIAGEMWVKKLMESGIDSIKWSVNFKDGAQFKEITGKHEILYEIALNNIRDAHRVRKEVGSKCSLSASSILYSPEHKALMEKLIADRVVPFVDKHYWLPLYQMSMYKDHMIKTLGYVPTAGNIGRLDDATLLPIRKSLPCWSSFTEGHVRVDGGLSACCFGADSRFDMGVLNGNNFMLSWNSSKFQALREAQLKTLTEGQGALKNTPCEVCVAYE